MRSRPHPEWTGVKDKSFGPIGHLARAVEKQHGMQKAK